MKQENNIQNAIRLALTDAGILSFRNNVGAYRTEDGHYVRYGVGEKGGSDLICITPVTITQEMVGQTVGVFTAIEVKTAKGRASKNQKLFIEAVQRQGGLAGIARSPSDALQITGKK